MSQQWETRKASFWKQSTHDLEHARSSVGLSDYDWAYQAAIHAAANAVKALLCKQRIEPEQTHHVEALLKALKAGGITVPQTMFDVSNNLHYLEFQHPTTGSWEKQAFTMTEAPGPPSVDDYATYELVSELQARDALDMAAMIIAWVSQQLE